MLDNTLAGPMQPSDGTLLALKALFLGRAADVRPYARSAATSMVDAAIRHLTHKRRSHLKLRCAFYHLVRAEILRHGGDPIPDRAAAKRIAAEIHSDLFAQFTRLEAFTLPLVEHHRRYGTGDRYVIATTALAYLGISRWDISAAQREFLDRITLAEVLENHGIRYPAA